MVKYCKIWYNIVVYNKKSIGGEFHGRKSKVPSWNWNGRNCGCGTFVDIDWKEYAVYSLDNDNGTVDILASYVEKDEEGYDKLVDINNPIDKEKVSNFIKSLVA